MSGQRRYRFDALRRFGTDLATAAGMPPARASAFVTSLLWYDAAGVSAFGIESLPDWLDAITRGESDPRAEPRILQETPATALLDASRALGPTVMSRAAEIAQQKAREVGVGSVRVANLPAAGSGAAAAALIAVGPMVATVQGPGPSWAVAVPMAGTVPAVFDTAIAPGKAALPAWSAWTSPLTGGSGWLVSAFSVRAFEPLEAFHERVGGLVVGSAPGPGEVRPEDWRRRRDELDAVGLAPAKALLREFERRAKAAGIAPPEPTGSDGAGRSA